MKMRAGAACSFRHLLVHLNCTDKPGNTNAHLTNLEHRNHDYSQSRIVDTRVGHTAVAVCDLQGIVID
jgi:hypothetical protein